MLAFPAVVSPIIAVRAVLRAATPAGQIAVRIREAAVAAMHIVDRSARRRRSNLTAAARMIDGDDMWHVERLAPGDAGASPAERDAQYRRDATWDRNRREATSARQRAATVTDLPRRRRLLDVAEQYVKFAHSPAKITWTELSRLSPKTHLLW